MDKIMKFVRKDGSTENITDVYTGKGIPPFYTEAFDNFSDYEFVGAVPVDPAQLLVVGEVEELSMMQVRDRTDASEELTARIDSVGFDGKRLILVEQVGDSLVVLSGHARLDYCKSRYTSILVYVVKSTKDQYDVNDTLDLQAALNSENDVADKVTVEALIKIAYTKIERNMGELVPGMPKNKETVRFWLKRIGADKQHKGIDGGPGGLAKVFKAVLRKFDNSQPEDLGIIPMKGTVQRQHVERMQTKAPEGVAWISLDVSSGTTTNSQALVGRVAKAVAAGAKEINIVLGSNEQDQIENVAWNRYLLIDDFFKQMNCTLIGLATLVGLNTTNRPQEDWERSIRLWTFANTVEEYRKFDSNPYGFKFPLIYTTLAELENKASRGLNSKKYNKRKAA